MAVAIDTGVLSSLNKFEEVDRITQPVARNQKFQSHAFKPVLRPDLQDARTRDLNLRSVVGTGDATWFSPSSENAYAPFADIISRREARAKGNFECMKYLWLSRLLCTRMLIRKVGAADWQLSLGCTHSTLAVAWPCTLKGKFIDVTITKKKHTQSVRHRGC